MKRFFVMLLVFALLLPCVNARAEEELTVDELMSYCDLLLAQALTEPPVTPVLDEEAGYCFDFEDFTLYSDSDTLTENSRIIGAEVRSAQNVDYLRGVGPYSPLEEALSAYPLDNQALAGTYDEAVLYIRGALPGTVNTGYMLRDGSRVLLVVHTIYTASGEMAEECSVEYVLEDNAVTAVRVVLGVTEATLDEAQLEIDRLAALQEKKAYSLYRGEAPTALAREDLIFGGVDFVSASAEDTAGAWGQPVSDTWETDGDGFLRVMQWEGAEAIFRYDGEKRQGEMRLLRVFGEELEGPRGLRVRELVESAMSRFPQERDAGILYGDGENAPYGHCEITPEGAYVVYAARVEEETVLLTLNFLHGRLVEIICTY